jgi:hypothetical protein
MSRYTTVYKEVEVDVDMDDFDDHDLLEELEKRGVLIGDTGNSKELLFAIYHKRRNGKDYQTDLDRLIYAGLGKII